MASQAKVQALYEAVSSSPFMVEYLAYPWMATPWLLSDEDIDRLIAQTEKDRTFIQQGLEHAPQEAWTPELLHTAENAKKALLHSDEILDTLHDTALQDIEHQLTQ